MKKFTTMSTKKLTALLETASPEDKVAIESILAARDGAKKAESSSAEAELTPEEKAAIKSAEAEQGKVEEGAEKKETKAKTAKEPAVKLTPEELEKEAVKAKEEALNHRCSVVLTGTAIRVDGTVIGILKDKRAMGVYLRIQTDAIDDIESRQVYKKFGSQDILIQEEIVEPSRKTSGKQVNGETSRKHAENWEAESELVKAAALANVGKVVQIDEEKTGRITGLLNDKRSSGMYYRIKFATEDGVEKNMHKVINYEKSEDGQIILQPLQGMVDTLDEEGLKVNEAYVSRESHALAKISPEEKYNKAVEMLEKAKKQLEKAQETVSSRETLLASAKAEYENWQKAQVGVAAQQSEATAEAAEPEATIAEDEELA